MKYLILKNNMNPDLNKANQEHKDLDNRSYIIGFEEGYNNALAYLEKTVEKLKDDTRKETGAFKYDFCYDEVLEAINKLKK